MGAQSPTLLLIAQMIAFTNLPIDAMFWFFLLFLAIGGFAVVLRLLCHQVAGSRRRWADCMSRIWAADHNGKIAHKTRSDLRSMRAFEG
jgi:hypothetical protein